MNPISQPLPDLEPFRGQTFVVKYGGSFMDSPDPAVRNGVVRDLVSLKAAGVNVVVVHGGGKAITRAMDAAGLKAQFIQGMRVTDEAAVAVVERVLSREINPEIVAAIQSLGGAARGFTGSDLFTCRKLWLTGAAGEKLDIGFVGEATSAKTEPLLECLSQGFIPVVSPTARDEDGHIYNCNADVAAAQAAIALKASGLVFMSDVPGLLRDRQNPESLIKRLATGEVDGFKRAGIIDQGMIPKVDSAAAAIQAGVGQVWFVDGRAEHSVLAVFAKEPPGTEIVA